MNRNQDVADSYCPSQDWDNYCYADRNVRPSNNLKLYLEWLTTAINDGLENIETCFIFWRENTEGDLRKTDDFWYWLNYGSYGYQDWLDDWYE